VTKIYINWAKNSQRNKSNKRLDSPMQRGFKTSWSRESFLQMRIAFLDGMLSLVGTLWHFVQIHNLTLITSPFVVIKYELKFLARFLRHFLNPVNGFGSTFDGSPSPHFGPTLHVLQNIRRLMKLGYFNGNKSKDYLTSWQCTVAAINLETPRFFYCKLFVTLTVLLTYQFRLRQSVKCAQRWHEFMT
jgi:hypothetical protein